MPDNNKNIMRVSDMKFLEPKFNCHHSGRDITISCARNNSNNINTFVIAFRNGTDKVIASNSRIAILIFGNRIYFKQSEFGYKISTQQAKSVSYVKFNFIQFGYTFEQIKDFIGEYKLHFDNRENLYFIETERMND